MTVTKTKRRRFIVRRSSLPGQEKLREIYDEAGVVVVQGAIPLSQLRRLQQAVQELFELSGQYQGDVHKTCAHLDRVDQDLLYQINKCVARTRAFRDVTGHCWKYAALLHEVRPAAMYMTGDVLFGLSNDDRLVIDWHQDSAYYPGIKDPSTLMNCWFPVFEDATIENGAISLLLGSSCEGRIAKTEHRRPHEKAFLSLVPDGVQDLEKTYEEYRCTCEVGDLVVFNSNMVHRSNFNSTDHTRFSGVMVLHAPKTLPEKFGWYD